MLIVSVGETPTDMKALHFSIIGVSTTRGNYYSPFIILRMLIVSVGETPTVDERIFNANDFFWKAIVVVGLKLVLLFITSPRCAVGFTFQLGLKLQGFCCY